ncbi:MAG: hypothetical protein JWN67_4670 [Actinomycetia bacterium]|nr:hypothetical protein [Actinomycetes bacterium]
MSVDAAVLADLAKARRSRRLADVDIFEKLYQAYLSVIAVGIVLAVGASAIGDDRVGAATLQRVVDDGPAAVGLLAALVLIAGLRSGARGGPLTLEAPFVSHVLLSPMPRDLALRDPAFRQVRQMVLAGGGIGALAGLLASHRLPVDTLPLIAWGALAGVVLGIASSGLAMIVAGYPVAKPIVHVLSLALLAGSAADVAAGTAWSPGSIVGRLALSGVHFDPAGLVAVPVAVAIAVGGIAVVGGTSIESAVRRAGLVSQLRLAVTRQDLRTVVLLQRRLAQDSARAKPWIRIPAGRRLPVFRRGSQGLARLPVVRIVRVVALCSVAVAAAYGTWRGTSPLIVVSGLALWGAALDVIEPLAQELDHPDRWAGYPVSPGDLIGRHLAAPLLGLVIAACVPVAALAAFADSGKVLATAAAVLIPACMAAVLGAAASVATAPFDAGAMATAMPEAIGTQLILRVAWPPGIAIIACLPVLAARGAEAKGLGEFPAATQYLFPLCLLLGAVSMWLARRKPEVV